MINLNINPYIAIIITIVNCFIGAIGAAIFKRIKVFNLKNIIMFKDWNFIIGASIYGFSAIFFVLMLKFVDLIVLYPITSITYVWSLLIGYFYFKEDIPLIRVMGVLFIILGASIMTVFY